MAFTETIEVFPRCGCLFIPIFDCSGNMAGEKMGRLNAAIGELLEKLKEIDAESVDFAPRIAPLLYSEGAEWAVEEWPVSVSDFPWGGLHAYGCADVGAAFELLLEKLRFDYEGGWMRRCGEFPVLVLFSSVPPTDEYRIELERLKKNRWYRRAFKLAVPMGMDADREMLAEFTGSTAAVLGLEAFSKNFIEALLAYAAAYFANPTGPLED